MNNMKSLLVVLALAASCAPFGEYAQLDAYEVHAGNCRLPLTPDHALLDAVSDAADAWSAATGCDVYIAEDGVPVIGVDEITLDGVGAIGATHKRWNNNMPGRWKLTHIEMWKELAPEDMYGTALHELAHALGGNHVEGSAVFGVRVERPFVIDQFALEEVCGSIVCR